MANEYDYEGGGGSSFVMGLLTGTVLGAGLGILFAPKSGSELRNQISDSAGTVSRNASEQYRKASEVAGNIAGKGRELYDRARDAVSRGSEEAKRYSSEVTSGRESTGGMPSGSRINEPSKPSSNF